MRDTSRQYLLQEKYRLTNKQSVDEARMATMDQVVLYHISQSQKIVNPLNSRVYKFE